jgi:hypothetical protein
MAGKRLVKPRENGGTQYFFIILMYSKWHVIENLKLNEKQI